MAEKKVVIIIQARMSSTRFPGKVLAPLGGETVLMQVVRRASRIRPFSAVVVATSAETSDDAISDYCADHGIDVFRDSLNDVLARYRNCAQVYGAETIVRITADCPLLDPLLSSRVLEMHTRDENDYTTLGTGFPDGVDTQIFSRRALELSFSEATEAEEREHIGMFVERNPHRFKSAQLPSTKNLGKIRLTLDFPEDYELITRMYDAYRDITELGTFEDLAELVLNREELRCLNSHLAMDH